MLLSETESTALERLLSIAKTDTGQGRRVAGFILAWWNAPEHGGFDVADLFALDTRIKQDIATIFLFLSRQNEGVYPTEYRADIEAIIRQWRVHPDVRDDVDTSLSGATG